MKKLGSVPVPTNPRFIPSLRSRLHTQAEAMQKKQVSPNPFLWSNLSFMKKLSLISIPSAIALATLINLLGGPMSPDEFLAHAESVYDSASDESLVIYQKTYYLASQNQWLPQVEPFYQEKWTHPNGSTLTYTYDEDPASGAQPDSKSLELLNEYGTSYFYTSEEVMGLGSEDLAPHCIESLHNEHGNLIALIPFIHGEPSQDHWLYESEVNVDFASYGVEMTESSISSEFGVDSTWILDLALGGDPAQVIDYLENDPDVSSESLELEGKPVYVFTTADHDSGVDLRFIFDAESYHLLELQKVMGALFSSTYYLDYSTLSLGDAEILFDPEFQDLNFAGAAYPMIGERELGCYDADGRPLDQAESAELLSSVDSKFTRSIIQNELNLFGENESIFEEKTKLFLNGLLEEF